MTKLDHALALAERGLRLHPLHPGTKKPQLEAFAARATTDERQLLIWFADDTANIGIATDGLVVVDFDYAKGPEAEEFERLQSLLHGWPDTFTVRTTSGGRHRYYRAPPGSDYGNSQSRLAPYVDTRGNGGNLVGPGSTIDGKAYEVENDAPIADAPAWLLSLLRERTVDPERQTPIDRAGGSADRARAEKYLRELDLAEGMFNIGCAVRDFGIEEPDAVEMIDRIVNQERSGGWSLEATETKVANAYAYAQNRQGARSVDAEFQSRLAAPAAISPDGLLTPVYPYDPARIPPRPWVFDKFAMAGKLTVLISPPGVGKSTLTIGMAASKASGLPLLGMDPLGRAPVAIWNQEDDGDELRRRLAATLQHHNLGFEAIMSDTGAPLLYLNSGEQRMLKIARKVGLHGGIIPEDADALATALKAAGIKMFVVDPFSETHPASENDNGEMLEVAKIYRGVAQKADCAVVIVHHTRKPADADSRGHVGNMDSGRGASSLSGVARLMATLYGMSTEDAKQFGVASDQRHRYVRLDDAKANMSLISGRPRWFERVSVTLPRPDGAGGLMDDKADSVGVLAPVALAEVSAVSTDSRVREEVAGWLQTHPGEHSTRDIAEALCGLPAGLLSGRNAEATRRRIDGLFVEQSDCETAQLEKSEKSAPNGRSTLFLRFSNPKIQRHPKIFG